TGSGTSASTRSSGPQYCEHKIAFMDIPVVKRRVEVGRFMPDLKPGYNLNRIDMPGQSIEGDRCLKKACWLENGYWSPAAARGWGLRWDAASSSLAPN